MIITIVQAEIETAIRDYILSQINLREGMNISIDLQATRGAEGFKAIIDVSSMPQVAVALTAAPVNALRVHAEVLNTVSPHATIAAWSASAALAPTVKETFIPFTRAPQTPAEVSQLMAAEYAKEDAADIVASVAETIIEARTNDDESDTPPAVVVETPAETTDTPVVVKRDSLFKGLRKPVNA